MFKGKNNNDGNSSYTGKLTTLFLVISFLVSFVFYSCKKSDTSTNPPAPTCDQGCQDEYTAYGMIDIFWFVWNQNIAGQPVGSKDFTVNGPQGGSIHVTGSTDYSTSTGVNTMHLTLAMTDCKGIGDKYALTFNGTVTADGTFSTVHKAVTFACSQLTYTGNVGKDNWVTDVNGTCPITFNQTLTSVDGTICGRSFNY